MAPVPGHLSDFELRTAMHMDWQDAEADTVLLVRADAAGMVTGKQGRCTTTKICSAYIGVAAAHHYHC